jgi:hypothetical protein
MVQFSEDLGYEEALVNIGGGMQQFLPEVRKGWRCIVDTDAQTNELWERVRPFVPQLSAVPSLQRQSDYGLVGLNSRLRYLKYQPGDYFAPHHDGTYTDADTGHRSFLTLQVYLNEGFEGGATTFFVGRDEKAVECKPEVGMVLIFEHHILHEGSMLLDGSKYAIRTDVMYGR